MLVSFIRILIFMVFTWLDSGYCLDWRHNWNCILIMIFPWLFRWGNLAPIAKNTWETGLTLYSTFWGPTWRFMGAMSLLIFFRKKCWVQEPGPSMMWVRGQVICPCRTDILLESPLVVSSAADQNQLILEGYTASISASSSMLCPWNWVVWCQSGLWIGIDIQI